MFATITIKFLFNLAHADVLGIPIGNRRLYLTQEILGRGNFGKVVKGELIGDNGSEAVAVKMLRGIKITRMIPTLKSFKVYKKWSRKLFFEYKLS